MSFYFTKQQSVKGLSKALLWQLQCSACPLDKLPNKHPHIEPHGSLTPDLYILGLGPGEDEDDQNQFFVGRSGSLLKSCLTQDQVNNSRFGNVTRTRHPENTPSQEAVECCRPSVEKDIALTKPKLILALGGYPLKWCLGTDKEPSINAWRGHPFPVRIKDHVCWCYPIFHPSYILRTQYLEHVFKLDIKNCYKFLERNLKPEVVDPTHAFDNCHSLYTLPDIKRTLTKLSLLPRVTIDLEYTAAKKPYRPYGKGAKIISIAVGTKDAAYSFGWKHKGAGQGSGWTSQEFELLYNYFHSFLRNKNQIKVAHNANAEIEWLVEEFHDPLIARCNWRDSMSPAYHLNYGGNVKENESGEEKIFKGLLSLDTLCKVYFGFWLKSLSKVNVMDLDNDSLESVLKYNAGDVAWTDALIEKLDEDVKYEGLENVVKEHDRRIPTIVLTQRKGLYYNKERAENHAKDLESKISKLYTEINQHVSVKEFRARYGEFNVNAPESVAQLFKYLGFNVINDDKKISSDEETLKKIDHSLVQPILELRELNHLKSAFIDVFLPDKKGYIVHPDELVHSIYTTHFTTSGRLSCNSPNVQQWPSRKNKYIRDVFIAPPNHLFLSLDLSQIQFRCFPMVTKDKKLIELITNGLDIHADWANRIGKKYPKRIGDINNLKDKAFFKAFRDLVKNKWVFPVLFGASAKSLAEYMNIPVSVADELKQEFLEIHFSVSIWQKQQYEFYNQHGYIESPTGHRRYAYMQGGEIINFPIQNLESVIVLDGMNRLSEYAVSSGKEQYQPVIMIHDDLGFYLPDNTWQEDMHHIVRTMLSCDFPWINVPIALKISVGPDLYNQTVYGEFSSAELNKI